MARAGDGGRTSFQTATRVFECLARARRGVPFRPEHLPLPLRRPLGVPRPSMSHELERTCHTWRLVGGGSAPPRTHLGHTFRLDGLGLDKSMRASRVASIMSKGPIEHLRGSVPLHRCSLGRSECLHSHLANVSYAMRHTCETPLRHRILIYILSALHRAIARLPTKKISPQRLPMPHAWPAMSERSKHALAADGCMAKVSRGPEQRA